MSKHANQPWGLSGFIIRNWKPLFIPPAIILLFSSIATLLYTQPLLLTSLGISSIAGTLPFWWVIPAVGVLFAATMLITETISLVSQDKAIVALTYFVEHSKADQKSMQDNVEKVAIPSLEKALEFQRANYANLPKDSAARLQYKNFVTQTLFKTASEKGDSELTRLLQAETAVLNKL